MSLSKTSSFFHLSVPVTRITRTFMVMCFAWIYLPGAGDIEFHRYVISDNEMNARGAIAADLNGDGHPDVIAASHGDNIVRWFRNDGGSPPGFHAHMLPDAGVYSEQDVCAAYIDGDEHLDLVVSPAGGLWDDLMWYQNDGAYPVPTFTAFPINVVGNLHDVHFIECADLDGDTDVDIAIASSGDMYGDDSYVMWLENDGDAEAPSFTTHMILENPGAWSLGLACLIIDDMEPDGDNDILVTSNRGGKVWLFENNGAQPLPSFLPHDLYEHGGVGGRTINSSDIDQDGHTDLVTAGSNSGGTVHKLCWYENISTTEYLFVEHVIDDVTPYLCFPSAADLDADGDIDIVAIGWASDLLVWYENIGESFPTFIRHMIDDTEIDYGHGVCIADLDEDNDQDILIASYNDSTIAWYRNSLGPRCVYVDDDAPPGGDGLSWNTAYRFLQDAISHAEAGFVNEIFIAEGVYYPDRDEANPTGTGDREETFPLLDGVSFLGGFRGLSGGGDPDDRNPDVFETVLSGDLNGDDVDFTNNSENSFTVVTGSSTNVSAILDGFMIVGGNADGSDPMSNGRGAGVYIDAGSPTLRSCRIVGNFTSNAGAGMYILNSSSPTLTDCEFVGNLALADGDGNVYGGGMVNALASSVILINCSFTENSVVTAGSNLIYGGGILSGSDCDLTLIGCEFEGNLCDGPGIRGSGGGVYNVGDLVVVDCTFVENTAHVAGGAISHVYGTADVWNTRFIGNMVDPLHVGGCGVYNYYAEARFVNCEFSGNRSTSASGGGLFNDHCVIDLFNVTLASNASGAIENRSTDLTLKNCILWANTGEEITHSGGGVLSISNSIIEGVVGNDPLFVNILGDDGNAGTEDDNLRLSPGSPAIDAGDNATLPSDVHDLDGDLNTVEGIPFDLDGNPRLVDDPDTVDTGNGTPPIVDIGPYEFQIDECPADLTGDDQVNIDDIFAMLGTWGACDDPCPPYCSGDLTEDCIINIDDIFAILGQWGPCE